MTNLSQEILYDVKYQKWKKEQEAYRCRENVEKERQEMEKQQKQKLNRENMIVQIKLDMDKMKKEIEITKRGKDKEERERYASNWWRFSTWLQTSETKEEKMNRERENLHQLVSERIKIKRLTQSRVKLQQSLDEQEEAKSKEIREYILRRKMEQNR